MTLIKTNKVFMNKNFTTQDEVMNFLADQSIVLSISEDRDAVYEKLMEREEESTTGMMDGFAIPHAKDASIKDADIVIVRLNGKVIGKV